MIESTSADRNTSLVNQWQKFLNFEAPVPEFSTMRVSPGDHMQYATHDARLVQETQLSLNELTHTNHEYSQMSQNSTRLSHLPSLPVDGTETQLLLESFNNAPQLVAAAHEATRGTRVLLHDESTLISQSPVNHAIIELDHSGSNGSYTSSSLGTRSTNSR